MCAAPLSVTNTGPCTSHVLHNLWGAPHRTCAPTYIPCVSNIVSQKLEWKLDAPLSPYKSVLLTTPPPPQKKTSRPLCTRHAPLQVNPTPQAILLQPLHSLKAHTCFVLTPSWPVRLALAPPLSQS